MFAGEGGRGPCCSPPPIPSCTCRSLLVYGNPLSLFDFTAVPVPELPGPLPAAAAGSRDPAVDPLPRNLNNSWRCISKLSAGGVEAAKLQYLEAVLGNDFMRTRLAYDRWAQGLG